MIAATRIDELGGRLKGLGFAPTEAPHCFEAEDLQLNVGRRWLDLVAAPATPPHPGAALGCPGLWKEVEREGRLQTVLDLPLEVLEQGARSAAADDACAYQSEGLAGGRYGALETVLDHDHRSGDDEDGQPVAALVDWARRTLRGELTPQWSAPAPEAILDLVPGGEPALSLRCGGLMERCRIFTDDRTLAFRVTLGRVDPGLSENRRLWLGQLLMDAGPVRLVRTGLRADGDGAWCAEAEVDLSGAPGGAIEVLVPAAVAALHLCYAWLAYPVTFLVDPACKSVALSEHPRHRTG